MLGAIIPLVNSFLWCGSMNRANMNSSEKILVAATSLAQAHGYGGLNVRNLAADVGIKAASLYHHFPSKADLAAAVARRYWESAATLLDELSKEANDPAESLRRYPDVTFRKSLENSNRMCLASFMSAEYDDLPEIVQKEVQAFADVNVEWLRKTLIAAKVVASKDAKRRASAIFAAVVGAQLLARGRSDVDMFDMLIDSYRASGLLPK